MGKFTICITLFLLLAIIPFSTCRKRRSKKKGASKFQLCERHYSKLGCVKEAQTDMILLVNHRSIIDWTNFQATMHSLACTCSEQARAAGYTYFSIRFWAECWVGKDLKAIKKVLSDKSTQADTCVGGDYKDCKHVADTECAGTVLTEYIYLIEPPVNGGWSKWSKWSKCDKTCGGGTQKSSRECNNPNPQYGGKKCSGPAKKTQACNTKSCSVDGGYSDWTSWSKCSKSCGGGTMTRSRACDNPKPQNGGKKCSDKAKEGKPCGTKQCPVDGGLSAWSGWSGCSKSCGPGIKTRSRSCTNPAPAHGGKGCSDHLNEKANCNLRNCGCSNSFRFLGRSKGCGPKYTSQGGRCDGWQRVGLSRCKQLCTQNAAPGGCPRRECHFVIWDTNPGTPPGWCQLGDKNCRQHGANGGHHLYARNC